MPSINDVTYPELIEIINKVSRRKVVNNLWCKHLTLVFAIVFKLKDADGKLAGVDASDLLVANSGNDLPVRIYQTLLDLPLWWPRSGIILKY
jgi:hypothetical protein